jgi:hypothetical protein
MAPRRQPLALSSRALALIPNQQAAAGDIALSYVRIPSLARRLHRI